MKRIPSYTPSNLFDNEETVIKYDPSITAVNALSKFYAAYKKISAIVYYNT